MLADHEKALRKLKSVRNKQLAHPELTTYQVKGPTWEELETLLDETKQLFAEIADELLSSDFVDHSGSRPNWIFDSAAKKASVSLRRVFEVLEEVKNGRIDSPESEQNLEVSEEQESEIHDVWMSVQERWSNDQYMTSQCQKILSDWRPMLMKRAEDAAYDIAVAFEHECAVAEDVLSELRSALLCYVTGEVKEEKVGTLWWIQDDHAINTQPDDWTHFSPMNEKWLNRATASYLEKPWLQHNFVDWAIINASLFNQLVELSNGLRSGQLLGRLNWAYIFSGNKLVKQQLWTVGFALFGFLARWIIPPAAAIALLVLKYGTAAAILGGLWAVYVLLRFVGLIVGWGERSAERTEVRNYTEMFNALIAVWLITNSNVINPTRLRELLVETDQRGVGFSVPAVVYSLVDRAIERDAAVFTHFFK